MEKAIANWMANATKNAGSSVARFREESEMLVKIVNMAAECTDETIWNNARISGTDFAEINSVLHQHLGGSFMQEVAAKTGCPLRAVRQVMVSLNEFPRN